MLSLGPSWNSPKLLVAILCLGWALLGEVFWVMRACPIICPSFKRHVSDVTSSLLLAYHFGFRETPLVLSLCFSCSLIVRVSRSFHFFLFHLCFWVTIFVIYGFYVFILVSLVFVPRIPNMASSGSQNYGRTPSERTWIPATPSCNVHISTFTSGLKYKFYLVEVIFPILKSRGFLMTICLPR